MAKASTPPTNVVQRRFNRKGLIILGVAIIVGLGLLFPLMSLSNRSTRESALAQVKASEKAGNLDLALRHVERYVATWPDDQAGLKIQARLLALSIQSSDQMLRAVQANDKALRVDPDGPDSQEIRRRLIRLYITLSDRIRGELSARKETGQQGGELRYRAAESLARQMIDREANDAEAHLLLALTLEGSAVGGDNKALDGAIDEFGRVLAMDPKDIAAAEHLAWLQFSRKKAPAAARATMDALLQAQPDSVPVRMARFQYFERAGDQAAASAELEAAAAKAPKDVVVQSSVAADAIRRRDYEKARLAIDAIPATVDNELRIRTLRGMLELNEQHPDEAIEEWRKGLVATEGTDLGLTMRLAYSLIQLGRLNEARPLVAQFQRLAGERGAPTARLLRALYELKAGHPGSAAKDLTRLTDQVGPDLLPEVYQALGRAHEALMDDSQALVAYRRLAALRPTSAEPRRAISRILALKNPADGLAELERALALNPNDPALLTEVGRLRFRQQLAVKPEQRRWEGVEAVVDQALKQDPKNFAAQTLRADVLAESGRMPEALGILKGAVDGPARDKLEVWLTYILALDRLGRFEEALKEIDRASAPGMVGDHASLRIARARILVETNRGQAARAVLTDDRDKVPKFERPELAHALAELCRELGDRDAARAALVDWAKQMPDSEAPGLNLISFAQTYDDDEAARLGLDALRSLGGDQEPYGLAARALELLRVGQSQANPAETTVATDPAELKRLDEADRRVTELSAEAPQLAIVPTLQGLILERRGRIDDAIEAYRRGTKDAGITPSLPRLVELLTRRQQFDEIERLKARYQSKADATGSPTLVRTFDQICANVALKLGDNQHAGKAVIDLIQAQPENLSLRLNLASLLVKQGKGKEADATLRQLTNLRPADTAPWLALVQFRVQHPELGDVNKLIDEVAAKFKGAHTELLTARLRWVVGDIPGAAKLYELAVARNGNDLPTLRDAVEFDEANARPKEAEVKLRRALAVDPKAAWAVRLLALILSNRPDRSSWAEAWSLIKPDGPAAGSAPEDRLVRATVLARSPEEAQRAQAGPALEALARDLPSASPVAVEVRVRLARAYLLGDRAGEAAALIAPIADDLDRPNAMALALGIEASARAKDIATARKRLARLETIEPKAPATFASRAWVQAGSNKPDEATATLTTAYDEAEAAEGGESLALGFQKLMARLGLKDGAMKLAERIARKWPKDAATLARMQLADGKVAEAIKSCQVAIEAGEVREAVGVASQILLEKRGDVATLQLVDDLASAAQAQAPKSPEVAVFVATLRHFQGRFDDEVRIYQAILATNPPRFGFLNNMAWTLSEGLQRYPEALERVDEAIRHEGLGSDNYEAGQMLDTKGVILFRLGRAEDAVKALEEGIKLDQLANRPTSATAYFHLARAYRKLDKAADYRRCRDLVRKLNLDPASLDPTDKADYPTVMEP